MKHFSRIFFAALALSFCISCSQQSNGTEDNPDPVKSSDSTLVSLSVSSGTISPQFSANVLYYSLSVESGTTGIVVAPVAKDPGASIQIRVNGGEYILVASGGKSVQLGLNVGSNIVDVLVTAEDSTSTTYKIYATRAGSANARLSSLTVSSGALDPVFSPAVNAYSVAVANSADGVTVAPTAENSASSIQIRVNGGGYSAVASAASSGNFPLNTGENNIEILVTAQDGSTNSYTLTVTRATAGDATLSGLAVYSERLSPAFSPAVKNYACTVANGVSAITVTPTSTETDASITVNGETVSTGTASPAIALAEGVNTVTVCVVSAHGGAKQTYTVAIKRAIKGPLLTLTYTYGTDGTSTAPNIYVIWLEDMSGNVIQNLYVCDKLLPGGGLTNTALPFWKTNRYDPNEVDGVTGATKKKTDFTVTGYLKDNDISKFKVCYETDHSFDANDWFSDQPAILYSAVVDRAALASPYTLAFEAWTPNEGTKNTLSKYLGSLVVGARQTLENLKFITHAKDASSDDVPPFGAPKAASSSTCIVGGITLTVE